ncbi:DUF5949 family protein [Streptomyces sp. NPDC085481]|uniref:DUF5949 family protein n=1 Tax=Streptomyces sp. NPDC085481 TaxID=3365727 RepID=UPI0037CED270
MSDNTTSSSSRFGQILCAAWIGKHPGDGGDFPMLMAYSAGDGSLGPAASRVATREMVAAWGMREGAMVRNPEIDGTPVVASLDDITVRVSGFPGAWDIVRPTSAAWAACARGREQILLMLTTRVWPEGPAATREETFAFIADGRTTGAATTMLLPLV